MRTRSRSEGMRNDECGMTNAEEEGRAVLNPPKFIIHHSSFVINLTLLVVSLLSLSVPALADQLKLADGTMMEVDEAWEDAHGVWYRRGGVTNLVEKSRVREVVKTGTKEAREVKAASEASVVKPVNDAAP